MLAAVKPVMNPRRDVFLFIAFPQHSLHDGRKPIVQFLCRYRL
jgi:hypothetical protein